VVAYKLTRTILAQIVLFFVRFFAISFYLCALAIGAVKGNFYFHKTKITLFKLIAKCLQQHTFYNTTKKSNSDKKIVLSYLYPFVFSVCFSNIFTRFVAYSKINAFLCRVKARI
jgi:hypothetical protein